MKEEIFESREKLAELVRKRKQRKRILAFVLAVTILLTFAVPISMMFPMPNSSKPSKDKNNDVPLYSVDAEMTSKTA
ncbi:MAG: hypothetical protein IKP69_12125 [Oscillospiraceae bacterium]|nr:hypothetical protein [Oscillospiraceae bacterium]